MDRIERLNPSIHIGINMLICFAVLITFLVLSESKLPNMLLLSAYILGIIAIMGLIYCVIVNVVFPRYIIKNKIQPKPVINKHIDDETLENIRLVKNKKDKLYHTV